MKFNEEFEVIIGNERFWNNRIERMSITFEGLEMIVSTATGSRYIKCALSEAEIIPMVRVEKCDDKSKTQSTEKEWVKFKLNSDPYFINHLLLADYCPYGEEKASLENILQAVLEAINERKPDPKTAKASLRTDSERALFCPYGMRKEYTGKAYCKVGDEPKSDIEVVYPFRRAMKKTIGETMEEMSASMKAAGASINEGLKAMAKSNESIKVDLSIDGKSFSKLIKKYNQDITRSGG